MAIKNENGKFRCLLCDKEFVKPSDVDMHMISDHHAVYVPFDIKDLQNLVNFIYSKNEKFLNPKMVLLMKMYLKHAMTTSAKEVNDVLSDM